MIGWVNIPESKYQISSFGQVRRVLSNGYRDLKTFTTRGYLAVNLSVDGKLKKYKIHKLMALSFNIILAPGEILYFINGVKSDCRLSNIGVINSIKFHKLIGFKNLAQQVAKIDRFGEIVEVYKSARECGRMNFMNYRAITDRCNNKIIDRFGLDGFDYKWDDDITY